MLCVCVCVCVLYYVCVCVCSCVWVCVKQYYCKEQTLAYRVDGYYLLANGTEMNYCIVAACMCCMYWCPSVCMWYVHTCVCVCVTYYNEHDSHCLPDSFTAHMSARYHHTCM